MIVGSASKRVALIGVAHFKGGHDILHSMHDGLVRILNKLCIVHIWCLRNLQRYLESSGAKS